MAARGPGPASLGPRRASRGLREQPRQPRCTARELRQRSVGTRSRSAWGSTGDAWTRSRSAWGSTGGRVDFRRRRRDLGEPRVLFGQQRVDLTRGTRGPRAPPPVTRPRPSGWCSRRQMSGDAFIFSRARADVAGDERRRRGCDVAARARGDHTLAPASRRRCAIAAPMPREPPVTRARRPMNSFERSSLLDMVFLSSKTTRPSYGSRSARLFQGASEDVQDAVLRLLRAVTRGRWRSG